MTCDDMVWHDSHDSKWCKGALDYAESKACLTKLLTWHGSHNPQRCKVFWTMSESKTCLPKLWLFIYEMTLCDKDVKWRHDMAWPGLTWSDMAWYGTTHPITHSGGQGDLLLSLEGSAKEHCTQGHWTGGIICCKMSRAKRRTKGLYY